MSLNLKIQFSAADALDKLAELQARIRQEPQRLDLRVLLFQIFCLQGEWAKATAQLKVIEGLSSEQLPMVAMYREALKCELLRRDVFSGKRTPLILGDPADWLARLLEANRLFAHGHLAQARELREQALEAAPVHAGHLDGQAFEWLADADSRLGPILEAIINGKYYWIPVQHLAEVRVEPPVDLRDLVWSPATLTFGNGGSQVALLPTRYPGTESQSDTALRLARKTVWQDHGEDTWTGLGQRMWVTDLGEHALLDVRCIRFEEPAIANEDELESGDG